MPCDCLFAQKVSLTDVYSVTSQCAFAKSLFIEVAFVVCSGQNAYSPVTLEIVNQCSFVNNICKFRYTT